MQAQAMTKQDWASHYKAARSRVWIAPAKPPHLLQSSVPALYRETSRQPLNDHPKRRVIDLFAHFKGRYIGAIHNYPRPYGEPQIVYPDMPLPEPSVSLIIGFVSDRTGISRVDIRSQRRTQCLVRPRMMAIWLCRTLKTSSLPELGRMFGGRDHTTILHSVRKYQKGIDAGTHDNPMADFQAAYPHFFRDGDA